MARGANECSVRNIKSPSVTEEEPTNKVLQARVWESCSGACFLRVRSCCKRRPATSSHRSNSATNDVNSLRTKCDVRSFDFGTVPAVSAMKFRLTIPEIPRYTSDMTIDVEKAQADARAYLLGKRKGTANEGHAYVAETRRKEASPKAIWTEFFAHFRQWKHGEILLGTAGSWFFIDIAFRGLGLKNSAILAAYNNFHNTAVGNLILAVAGNIPGYWVSVAIVDTIGRNQYKWPASSSSRCCSA